MGVPRFSGGASYSPMVTSWSVCQSFPPTRTVKLSSLVDSTSADSMLGTYTGMLNVMRFMSLLMSRDALSYISMLKSPEYRQNSGFKNNVSLTVSVDKGRKIEGGVVNGRPARRPGVSSHGMVAVAGEGVAHFVLDFSDVKYILRKICE